MVLQLKLHANLTGFIIHMGKGKSCTLWEKVKHLGSPVCLAQRQKSVEKAIRAFEKFAHGKVGYANPLQHCLYGLGPLERLVSQSRKQLWAISVTHKSFVRKKKKTRNLIMGFAQVPFLSAEKP